MHYIKKVIGDLKIIPLYFNSLNFKGFLLFLRHPVCIRRCIIYLNAVFSEKDNKLIMTFKPGISINVDSISTIDIVLEIFLKKLYSINNIKSSCSVIDIGMNVGIASLYFALMGNVNKIYAFEPFKKTFEQAEYNFSLNAGLKSKIIPANCGISDKNAIIDAAYNPKFSSILSTTSAYYLSQHSNRKQIEQVQIKSAATAIGEIVSKKSEKIILKIDCEGAEYEIFDSLDKAGIFENIDYVLLEWHFRGDKPLLDILAKYGYISIALSNYNEYGMIYAVKA